MRETYELSEILAKVGQFGAVFIKSELRRGGTSGNSEITARLLNEIGEETDEVVTFCRSEAIRCIFGVWGGERSGRYYPSGIQRRREPKLWTPPTAEQLEEQLRKAREWSKEHGDHPTEKVKETEKTKRNPHVVTVVYGRITYAPIDQCENPFCPIVRLTKKSTGEPIRQAHHALGVANDDTVETTFRVCGYCHDTITSGGMEALIWNQALLDMAAGKIPSRQPEQQPVTWVPLEPTPLTPVIIKEPTPVAVAPQISVSLFHAWLEMFPGHSLISCACGKEHSIHEAAF